MFLYLVMVGEREEKKKTRGCELTMALSNFGLFVYSFQLSHSSLFCHWYKVLSHVGLFVQLFVYFFEFFPILYTIMLLLFLHYFYAF